MEQETWKPIPGAEDYLASSLGRIKRAKPDSCGRSLKVLSQATKVCGHKQVSICRDRRIKSEMVHRLVALAFHGPAPAERQFCCHIDGNPANNRPENLYWGDAKLNGLDMIRHGRAQIGRRNVNAKLTEDQVRALRKDTRSSTLVAKEYGLSVSAVCRIRKGEGWRHVI